MNKYYQTLKKILEQGKPQTNRKGKIRYLLNEQLSLMPAPQQILAKYRFFQLPWYTAVFSATLRTVSSLPFRPRLTVTGWLICHFILRRLRFLSLYAYLITRAFLTAPDGLI